MRTLKKSLALVLALVMVLGLGVIGASADNALDNYTDASEIGDAYYEAVGVLTGLGIIDGMTETTIEPTGTYTREQAAKIIATMVLGVKNAESLTCVEAPFDDVPADRWSAGYIAFCVEQGIIDGMTDTTFEPTGTLTGFQWAKMLLAAVGFGANGEFTGTSWSLNTARVAHEAGLFTGDLSGADHVNLSRQQAALYAFNTLTEIKQVSYSANNDNYIYGLEGYVWFRWQGSWWADGTGHTLAETVFSLTSDEGIITDNEGMGNKTTVLSKDYDGTGEIAKINADTDAFMMYHAARIWYVIGGTRNNPTTEAVFVNDLAKVTTLECPSQKAMDDLDDTLDGETVKWGLWIGNDANGSDIYEYAAIDNSAADLLSDTADFGVVKYFYTLRELGDRDKSTLDIGNDFEVDYDDVWTDIDDIHEGDDVIVLEARSTGNDSVYYVYAVGTTSGAVEYVSSKGVITLTDGTVLAPSVFYNDKSGLTWQDVAETVHDHTSPNYSFKLDTHGHYYYITDSSFRTLGYWTGDLKSDFNNVWSSDVEYLALFFDVDSGTKVEVPVTRKWANANRHAGGYYDITDELYGDSRFAPVRMFNDYTGYGVTVEANDDSVRTWTYAEYYYFDTLTLTTNGRKAELTGANADKHGDVTYDADDETIRIVVGDGEDAVVNSYSGVADLLDDYSDYFPADSITLKDVVIATVDSVAGNKAATVIFAPESAADFVLSGIVFLPEGLGASNFEGTGTGFRVYDSAYFNGMELEDGFRVADTLPASYTPGFYAFKMDAVKLYVTSLEPVDTFDVSTNDDFDADGDASDITLKDYPLAEDCVIADIREDNEEYMTFTELAHFLKDDFHNENAQLVFTVEDKEVTVIYVVDANSYTVDVIALNETEAAEKGYNYLTGFKLVNDTVTVGAWNTSEKENISFTTTAKMDFTKANLYVSVNGEVEEYTADEIELSDDQMTATIEVTITDPSADIVIYGYKVIGG